MLSSLYDLEDANTRLLLALQSRPPTAKSPSEVIFEIKHLYMASHYHDCIAIARREISYTNETVTVAASLKAVDR
jgi:hypothetical protein